jgi:hypothetical protein
MRFIIGVVTEIISRLPRRPCCHATTSPRSVLVHLGSSHDTTCTSLHISPLSSANLLERQWRNQNRCMASTSSQSQSSVGTGASRAANTGPYVMAAAMAGMHLRPIRTSSSSGGDSRLSPESHKRKIPWPLNSLLLLAFRSPSSRTPPTTTGSWMPALS